MRILLQEDGGFEEGSLGGPDIATEIIPFQRSFRIPLNKAASLFGRAEVLILRVCTLIFHVGMAARSSLGHFPAARDKHFVD